MNQVLSRREKNDLRFMAEDSIPLTIGSLSDLAKERKYKN